METRPTLIAELSDRQMLARLVRAALLHEVAHVPLAETPTRAGPHTLQLRLGAKSAISVRAEPAGTGAKGAYPLRLKPLDPSHVGALTALLEDPADTAIRSGVVEPPVPSPAVAATQSAIFDSEPPLPKTSLPVPAPAPVVPGTGPQLPNAGPPSTHREEEPDSLPEEGDVTESVLFDPEAALISRAPPRATQGVDDTLTVPFRASMPPARMVPEPTFDGASTQPMDASAKAVVKRFSTQKGLGIPREDDDDDEDVSITLESAGNDPAAAAVRLRSERPPESHEDDVTVAGQFVVTPRPRGVSEAPAPPADPIIGRTIAGKYVIEALVGSGAVGAVYRASHTELARTVAIKVLHAHYRSDPDLMKSFRAEARAASLLDHPNVTVVHDFGEETDGLVYIVMEFLSGRTLQALLDKQQRLEPRRAIEIMLQVCAALSAAHERNVVHRDVKPDNIVLIPALDDEDEPYDMVKVCDFGIAALESHPPPDAAGQPAAEFTAGTPEYMAPEQATGSWDPRTDVYACGIVLYEMLTGKPPFSGPSAKVTLAMHQNDTPDPPSRHTPGIPVTLEDAVLRAIEKLPENRFPTMRELRVRLKRILGEIPKAARSSR